MQSDLYTDTMVRDNPTSPNPAPLFDETSELNDTEAACEAPRNNLELSTAAYYVSRRFQWSLNRNLTALLPWRKKVSTTA